MPSKRFLQKQMSCNYRDGKGTGRTATACPVFESLICMKPAKESEHACRLSYFYKNNYSVIIVR